MTGNRWMVTAVGRLRQLFGRPATTGRPPTLLLDDEGVAAVLNGVQRYQMFWRNVRDVSIEVVTSEAGEYSEAFWVITGADDDSAFVSPVEVVVGAEELLARLRQLPGFGEQAYQHARAAEERGLAGMLQCWSRE